VESFFITLCGIFFLVQRLLDELSAQMICCWIRSGRGIMQVDFEIVSSGGVSGGVIVFEVRYMCMIWEETARHLVG
jgi:hypothetical protein